MDFNYLMDSTFSLMRGFAGEEGGYNLNFSEIFLGMLHRISCIPLFHVSRSGACRLLCLRNGYDFALIYFRE